MMLLLKDEKGIITRPSAFEVAAYIIDEFTSYNMIEDDYWVTAMAISDLATDIMKAYEERNVEPLLYWLGETEEWKEYADVDEAKKMVEEVIEDVRGTANN